jgi:hypothetical protein
VHCPTTSLLIGWFGRLFVELCMRYGCLIEQFHGATSSVFSNLSHPLLLHTATDLMCSAAKNKIMMAPDFLPGNERKITFPEHQT